MDRKISIAHFKRVPHLTPQRIYPLFLADKKAKCVLSEMRSAYWSTVAFEMANSEFDQQALYEGLEIADHESSLLRG